MFLLLLIVNMDNNMDDFENASLTRDCSHLLVMNFPPVN